MTKVLNLQNDAQALITVDAFDAIQAPIAVPAGGTVASSDPSVFAASITADWHVLVVPVAGATGSGTLTYTNGALSDSATVNVTTPAIASVSIDVANAVITAQTVAAS